MGPEQLVLVPWQDGVGGNSGLASLLPRVKRRGAREGAAVHGGDGLALSPHM
jgi:hypothetical protein